MKGVKRVTPGQAGLLDVTGTQAFGLAAPTKNALLDSLAGDIAARYNSFPWSRDARIAMLGSKRVG